MQKLTAESIPYLKILLSEITEDREVYRTILKKLHTFANSNPVVPVEQLRLSFRQEDSVNDIIRLLSRRIENLEKTIKELEEGIV